MSVTEEPVEVTADPEPVPTDPAPAAETRYCELQDCPNTLPPDAHARRRYCDEHDGRSPERRSIRRAWIKEHGGAPAAGDGGTDQPPRVAFEVGKAGGGKGKGQATAAELAAVEARAKQITKGLAILVLVGQPDENRRADAADILKNADTLAAATRDLAAFEPWLRKLGAGGDVSERSLAWGAFMLALGTMALPILIRHEVIKGAMANGLAAVIDGGALAGGG